MQHTGLCQLFTDVFDTPRKEGKASYRSRGVQSERCLGDKTGSNNDQGSEWFLKLGVQYRGDADKVRVEVVQSDNHEEERLVVPNDLYSDAKVADTRENYCVPDTQEQLEILLVLAWLYQNRMKSRQAYFAGYDV